MGFYYLWPRLMKELKFSFYTWAMIRYDRYEDPEGNTHFKAKYYLLDYRDNLIDTPMERHAKELEIDKYKRNIACIDSKRALLFNLYGNRITFIVWNHEGIPTGKYNITYMKRVQVINCKNITIKLDAVLHSEKSKSLVIPRVRMFEWLVLKNETIKDSYMDINNYINRKAGRVFVDVVKKLLTDLRYDCEDTVGKFTNLDGLHIIKEIIAAYNLLSTQEEYKDVETVTILDVYWKPTRFENLGQAAGRVYVKEKLMLQELEEFNRIIKPVRFLFLKHFGVDLVVHCVDLKEAVMMQIKDQRQTDWYFRYRI